MKFLSTLFIVVFAFFLSTFIIPSYAFGQTPDTPTNPYMTPLTNSDVPANQHTYTQSVVIEILSAFICQLSGYNMVEQNTKCLGVDIKTKKIGYVESNGGAIGFVGSMIAATYNIPLSSTQYVAYLSNNFGLAKGVYADDDPRNGPGGIGFNGLGPLVKIWEQFRNIAYLLFVLIFVILGLAIMFRLQIDARTVMTVQNQIPKIIIGLLLVTFSYAIAGFLVDIMWISTYVSARVISNASTKTSLYNDVTGELNSHPIAVADKVFQDNPDLGIPAKGIFQLGGMAGYGVGEVVKQSLSKSLDNDPSFNNMQADKTCPYWGIDPRCWGNVVTLVGDVVRNAIGAVLGFIVGTIVSIVIYIALLAALFRLWIALVKAYVFILIDVALAPLWIMSGLLPGGPGFGGWIRDLGANLAAYPVTVSMFLLARVFVDNFGGKSYPGQFVPPLIGNPGAPNALGGLIAMGIILITPEVVTITHDFLKAPQMKYLSAVGAGVSAGQGFLGAGTGFFFGRMMQRANTSAGIEQGFLRRALIGKAGSGNTNVVRRLIRAALNENTK